MLLSTITATTMATNVAQTENLLEGINLFIGLSVLVMLGMFVYWLVRQVASNERSHRHSSHYAPHHSFDAELGPVMADGGAPMEDDGDEKAEQSK